jgi:ureidoacrylate peracid hydrolase
MPHAVEMPPYVIERIMAKRGRLNVFERFAPKETALVVIDMQNFFVADVEAARSICPNINLLAAALRARGGCVAWVQMELADGPDGPSKWPLYHEHFFSTARAEAHKLGCTKGSEGVKIYPDLRVEDGDIVTHKKRFSAFIQGSSDLHDRLQKRAIRSLLIAGTVTNFCCETSARDAMMLDYRVAMVSDACAARYDEDHIVGLTSVWQSFGDVRTVDDCITNLLAEAATKAAE